MKRKRSKLRAANAIIDRTAQSFQKAGIPQDRVVIRLGGQRPKRWTPSQKQLPPVQN